MSAAAARRRLPGGETLAWMGLLVTTELLLVVGYVLLLDVQVRDPALFVVPFVWIDAAILAVVGTDLPATGRRTRRIAGAVAVAYFLLLAYVGGLVGAPSGPVSTLSLSLTSLPPGWSPALRYNGVVSLVVLPYKAVGYAALAYLVYATVLDASGAVLGGVVGVLSCVSCTFPVLAGLLTGLAGGGSALAAAATGSGYLLSTVAFVVTVALLYWRPAAGLGSTP
jgi:hypothetical protein